MYEPVLELWLYCRNLRASMPFRKRPLIMQKPSKFSSSNGINLSTPKIAGLNDRNLDETRDARREDVSPDAFSRNILFLLTI